MQDSPEVLQRVQEGLTLARKVAWRVTATMGRTADFEEAVAWARFELFEAARRYKPTGAASFQTYAADKMERAILDGLRKASPLPRRVNEKLAADDSVATRARNPARDPARLREQHLAGIATAQVNGLLAKLGLNTQEEFIAVSSKTTPEEASQRTEFRELLDRTVASLPPEEALVIRRFYLDGDTTIERLAAEIGRSRATTQSLHDRALQRLRKRLAKFQ